MDASTEVEAEFVSEETMRDEWQWSEILFSILTPYNIMLLWWLFVILRSLKCFYIWEVTYIELRTASSPPI